MPQITCPHCRQPYDIPPEQWPQYQGQRINCTRCNQPFDVVGPSAPPTAPPLPGGPPAYPQAGYGAPYTPPPKGTSGAKIALLISGVVIVVLLVGCAGLMAILVPSLNRAREQANRVKSGSNLRSIGVAAMMYANLNQGRFPNDEKTLVKTHDIPAEIFVSPRTRTEKPTIADVDKVADWVNDHSDYAWAGAGLDTTTSTPDTVLAYEKPEGLKEGIEVLFADGHVDWVAKPRSDAMVSDLKQGKNPPPSLAVP